MASTAHPSFPQRPYSSTLHGKLPERSNAANNAFGTTHPAPRDTGRLERERQDRERAQREAAAAAGAPQVTEEQREEINEAVCHTSLSVDGDSNWMCADEDIVCAF